MVHSLTCRNEFSCHCWCDVVSGHWSNDNCTQILRRVFQVKELPEYSQEAILVDVSKYLDILTLEFSTVVGFLDIFMVSNLAELRSFWLTRCILAPGSTTNSLSSSSFIDVTGNTHSSGLVFLFELVFLARFHVLPRAHRSCLSLSSRDQSSNFRAWGLRWWGILTCICPSDGSFFSPILARRSVDCVNRTRRIGPKTFCIGFPYRFQWFRVLRQTTQLWYNSHTSYSTFVVVFRFESSFSAFYLVVLQPCSAGTDTSPLLCIPIQF